MSYLDDRESPGYTSFICPPAFAGSPTAWAEEGEYGPGTVPTEPRLGVDDDRQRAWPVASECVPSDEKRTELPPDTCKYRAAIVKVLGDLQTFLLAKNDAYGNSAFEPINVFSNLGPREGILLRLDDKLKRIKNGRAYPGDDNLKDAAGYLVLLLAFDEVSK